MSNTANVTNVKTHLFIEEVAQMVELLGKLHVQTRRPVADYVERKPVTKDPRGPTVEYMGHASVCDALLAHDPLWSWEPFALDEQGLPLVLRDKEGRPRAMWGRLTIHGHTRIGVGTCESTARDPYKELIGDFIRNAAMRFGVGLSLWAKSEWADEPRVELSDARPTIPERSPRPPEVARGPLVQGEGGPPPSAIADGAPEPSVPEPPSPSLSAVRAEGRNENQKQLNSIMAKCREMDLPEALRHNLIKQITDNRTVHVSCLESPEAAQFHLYLHTLRGRKVPEELPEDLAQEVLAWLNRPSPI